MIAMRRTRCRQGVPLFGNAQRAQADLRKYAVSLTRKRGYTLTPYQHGQLQRLKENVIASELHYEEHAAECDQCRPCV